MGTVMPCVYEPTLMQAGIQMTHDLDARFGLPPKHTLSQRDVPGMTRSVIPILKAYGVDAISVGANDGSTPPNVPDVKGARDWTNPEPFVWQVRNHGLESCSSYACMIYTERPCIPCMQCMNYTGLVSLMWQRHRIVICYSCLSSSRRRAVSIDKCGLELMYFFRFLA